MPLVLSLVLSLSLRLVLSLSLPLVLSLSMRLVLKLRPEASTELAFSILSRRFGLLVVISAHLSTVLCTSGVGLNTFDARSMGLHPLILVQREKVIEMLFD